MSCLLQLGESGIDIRADDAIEIFDVFPEMKIVRGERIGFTSRRGE